MKGKWQRLFTGLALSLLSAACSAGSEDMGHFSVSDSLGVRIAENGPAEMRACTVGETPRVSIGTSEGEEAYQLYRVFGATVLSDGRIALVNQGSQELRFYDSTGVHLMNAGRAGEGPGEFNNAFYLWSLPGDTIWVGDYRPFQFLVFSPEGEWVRTVRPTPQYLNSPGVMNLLDDGRAVLGERPSSAGAGPGFHLRHQPVVVHAPDGTLTDSIGLFPNGRWGQIGDDPRGPYLYPFFESFSRVAALGDQIVIGHGSAARLDLYSVGERPVLTGIVTWDPGDRTIRPGDVAAERAAIRARYEGMDPAAVERLVAPLVSDERPVADQFPAFTGIRLGPGGRIWLRAYPRPGVGPAQEWFSFESDGRLSCSLTVDADEVLEFGTDYVLVLHRDELGVERVQLFDVGQPSA